MAAKKTNKKSLSLFPLNLPHKYYHKFVKRRGISDLSSKVIDIGSQSYCIRAKDYGRISAVQVDASYKFLKKAIKKTGQVFLRVYPWLPLTKKPGETRMGKGKSRIYDYVYPVKPGKIIFEIKGLEEKKALTLLTRIITKISVETGVFALKR